jgi:hypothetical protein
MLEHLETAEEYRLGAEHVREAASLAGVGWVPAGRSREPA